eukprot:8257475-Lingulodinium_polyedra.AAC.1
MASSSTGTAPPQDGPVAQGELDMKALKEKCKNQLFVAGAIMCHEELYQTTKMAYCLLAPLWAEHGQDASTVRSPDLARDYYVSNAKGKYMGTLVQ